MHEAQSNIAKLQNTLNIQHHALVDRNDAQAMRRARQDQEHEVTVAAYEKALSIMEEELQQAMDDNILLLQEIELCK